MIQLKRNKRKTHVTDELLELVEEKAPGGNHDHF